MKDYEATAYLSLEKLKERHAKEMEDLQNSMTQSTVKYSTKVLDLRRKVEVLTNQREYEKADQYKQLLIRFEDDERAIAIKELRKNAVKKEKKLKQLHQSQMAALLMRIQRDRNEQLKHR